VDWRDIPNEKHRKVVQLYVDGWTLKAIAKEMEYDSHNGFRIVARILRRLRNQGYDIPRKLEFT
jgi:DNA-directed RNA polymerase specialized sigma24 family protein